MKGQRDKAGNYKAPSKGDQKKELRLKAARNDRELRKYLEINDLSQYESFLTGYRDQIEIGAQIFDPTYLGKNILAITGGSPKKSSKLDLAILIPIFLASLFRNTEAASIMNNATGLAAGEGEALPKLTDGYKVATGLVDAREYAGEAQHGAEMSDSKGGLSLKSGSMSRVSAGERARRLRKGKKVGSATATSSPSLAKIREGVLRATAEKSDIQVSPSPLPKVGESARPSASLDTAREKVPRSKTVGPDIEVSPSSLPRIGARKLLGRANHGGVGIYFLNPDSNPPTIDAQDGKEAFVLSTSSPTVTNNDFTDLNLIQGNAVPMGDGRWVLGKYIFTQYDCDKISVSEDSGYDEKGSPLPPKILAFILGNLDLAKDRGDNGVGITFGQNVTSAAMGLEPFKSPIEIKNYKDRYIGKPVIIPLESQDGRFAILNFNYDGIICRNLLLTYARNGASVGAAHIGQGDPQKAAQFLLISDPEVEIRALLVSDSHRIVSIDKYGKLANAAYIYNPEGYEPSLAKYDNGKYYFLFKDGSGNIIRHVEISSSGDLISPSYVSGSPLGSPVIPAEMPESFTLPTGDVVLVDNSGEEAKVYLKPVTTIDNAVQSPAYFVNGFQDARSEPVQRAIFPLPNHDNPESLLNLSEVSDNSLTYISGYFLNGAIALPLSATGPENVIYGTIAEADFPVSGLPFSTDSLVQKIRAQKPVSAGLPTYAAAVFPGNKVLIFPNIKNKDDLKTIVEASPAFVFNPVVTRSATTTLEQTSSRTVTRTTSICAGVTKTKTVTTTPTKTVTLTETTSPSGTTTTESTTTPTATPTVSPSGIVTIYSSTVTSTVTKSPSGTITSSSTTSSTATSTTTPSENGTGSTTVTVTKTPSPSGTTTTTKTAITTPLPSGIGSLTKSSSVTTTPSGGVISSKTATKTTSRTRKGVDSIKVTDRTGGSHKVPIIAGAVVGGVVSVLGAIAAYLACLTRKREDEVKFSVTKRNAFEDSAEGKEEETGGAGDLAGEAAPVSAPRKPPTTPPMAGRGVGLDIESGRSSKKSANSGGYVGAGSQEDIDTDEEQGPTAASVAHGQEASDLSRATRMSGTLDGGDLEADPSEKGTGAGEGSTSMRTPREGVAKGTSSATDMSDHGRVDRSPLSPFKRGGIFSSGRRASALSVDIGLDEEAFPGNRQQDSQEDLTTTAAAGGKGAKGFLYGENLDADDPEAVMKKAMGFDPAVKIEEGVPRADNRGILSSSDDLESDVASASTSQPDKSSLTAGMSARHPDIVGKIMASGDDSDLEHLASSALPLATAASVAGGKRLSHSLVLGYKDRGFLVGTNPDTEYLLSQNKASNQGAWTLDEEQERPGGRPLRGVTTADDIEDKFGRAAPHAALPHPAESEEAVPHMASARVIAGDGAWHSDLEGRTLPEGNGISTVPEGPADTSHNLVSGNFRRVERRDELDGKSPSDEDGIVVEDIEDNEEEMLSPEGDATRATVNRLAPNIQHTKLNDFGL